MSSINISSRRKSRQPSVRLGNPRRSTGAHSYSMGSAPLSLHAGVAATSSQQSVANIKSCNDREKHEMQGLNCKLANHLEKTRYLEAENRHLKELLSKSKVEFNVEIIKRAYDEQLDDLKRLLEEKDKQLAEANSRNEGLEEEVEDLREQLRHLQDVNDKLQLSIDGLNDEVARRTADSELCRRRAAEAEKQLADMKTKNGILDGQLNELRVKLQNETTLRLAETARVQALEDELAFLTDVHTAEVKEYQLMLSKSQSIPDFRSTWKSEFGDIVAQLSAEYETQLQQVTAMMETQHAAQMQQLKSGARPAAMTQSSVSDRRQTSEYGEMAERLSMAEAQIATMREKIRSLESELEISQNQLTSERAQHQSEMMSIQAEMEQMMLEFQQLIDAKLSLELEIAAYRKLLDAEEGRMSFSGMVSSVGGYQTATESALSNAIHSGGGKLTVSRSSSATVSVIELESDGEYIEIEDTATFPKKTANLKGWSLKQKIGNNKIFSHTFSDGNVFSAGKSVKIWGSRYSSKAGKYDIVSNSVTQWGLMSSPSAITLLDEKEKEIAAYNIKLN